MIDEIKELSAGLYLKKNSKNKFTTLSLYWWAHPLRDENWKKEMISTIGVEDFSREYELDWTQEAGKKVYANFSEENIKRLSVIPNLSLLVGWDFGFHHPAVCIGQMPTDNRVIILDEIMGNDILLDDFVKEFLLLIQKKYQGFKMRHFCDPAGKQKKDTSEKTSIDILRKFKIYPYTKKVSIDTGLAIVRRKISEKGEDEYRNLLIDVNCKILIEGFLGGYVFPEGRDGVISEDPASDGYYEHTQDCLKYLITGVFKNVPSTRKEKEQEWWRRPKPP